jgi:hypothetical protein
VQPLERQYSLSRRAVRIVKLSSLTGEQTSQHRNVLLQQ